jgi:hypothetical protein
MRVNGKLVKYEETPVYLPNGTYSHTTITVVVHAEVPEDFKNTEIVIGEGE